MIDACRPIPAGIAHRQRRHGVLLGPEQVELLNTRRRTTSIELAGAIADYFDNFYNVERRHSYLGNISPAAV